jgi:hypothetical protein
VGGGGLYSIVGVHTIEEKNTGTNECDIGKEKSEKNLRLYV